VSRGRPVNGAVALDSLRQSRRTIFVLAVAAAAFYFLVLLSSSSFLTEGSGFDQFLKNPPRGITALLGGSVDFFHPAGWLATAMLHPVTIALLTAAGMTVAAGAVAAEVERGTIDLVLTRPVGRTPYLLGKAAAAIAAVTVVEVAGLIGVLIARASISKMNTLPVGGTLLGFAGSWALFVAFAMLTLLVSTRTSLRSRATGISVGIVVGTFFVNYIALLIDGLAWMRFASPFHYFSPSDLIAGDSVGDPFVLLALALVALAAAIASFARRDLTR
jgi:ABC-2 type transport system permease protein